jgi:hypothetical protein
MRICTPSSYLLRRREMGDSTKVIGFVSRSTAHLTRRSRILFSFFLPRGTVLKNKKYRTKQVCFAGLCRFAVVISAARMVSGAVEVVAFLGFL